MFSTEVTKNEDGTYKVVGGKADGDNNVYLSGTKTVVAKSVTDHSFLYDDGKAAIGAIIDLSDKSGANFLNDKIMADVPGLFEYKDKAKGGEELDFKTNGPKGDHNGIKDLPVGVDKDAY